MVRRLLMGTVVVMMAVAWMSVPAAAQSRKDGDVTFTVGVLPGESTLRAEGKGITFFKRVTADRVHVRIDVPGDSFEIEAGRSGSARLTRNSKRTNVRMTAGHDEVAKAQQFAAGSKALAGFESLAGALESSPMPEAQSVMTSFALLHAVRGSVAPARAMAKAVRSQRGAHLTRASSTAGDQSALDCWLGYSSTVNNYLYEYAQCYEDYGWLPGMQAVCTFEWVVKVELAWFALIGCSGGMPLL